MSTQKHFLFQADFVLLWLRMWSVSWVSSSNVPFWLLKLQAQWKSQIIPECLQNTILSSFCWTKVGVYISSTVGAQRRDIDCRLHVRLQYVLPDTLSWILHASVTRRGQKMPSTGTAPLWHHSPQLLGGVCVCVYRTSSQQCFKTNRKRKALESAMSYLVSYYEIYIWLSCFFKYGWR